MPSSQAQSDWSKRPENRLKKLEHKARTRYGISREKQLELYTRSCEICGSNVNARIDHRRSEPGTYRGVLCNQCNTRLGWFESNREVIMTYVDRPAIKTNLGEPVSPSGTTMNFETVHQEGDSTSETHDLCVCSTLYNTTPNLPSTSGEYHNESRQKAVTDQHPWAVKLLNG